MLLLRHRFRVAALPLVLQPMRPMLAGATERITREQAAVLGGRQGPGIPTVSAPLPATAAVRAASRAWLTQSPRLQLVGGGRAIGPRTGPELGLSLTQDIPLGDVRGARQSTARAMTEVVGAEREEARLAGAPRAALAWVDALEAVTLLELRRRSLEQARFTAARRGAHERLRPVLGPLASVVIGGLGTSTLLTLGLLPALHAWVMRRQAHARHSNATSEEFST